MASLMHYICSINLSGALFTLADLLTSTGFSKVSGEVEVDTAGVGVSSCEGGVDAAGVGLPIIVSGTCSRCRLLRLYMTPSGVITSYDLGATLCKTLASRLQLSPSCILTHLDSVCLTLFPLCHNTSFECLCVSVYVLVCCFFPSFQHLAGLF